MRSQNALKRPTSLDPQVPQVLLAALRELDQRLRLAAESIKTLFGPDVTRDFFRGLHITPDDLDTALAQVPCEPLLGPLGLRGTILPTDATRASRFQLLATEFGLSPFDLDVLLIGLAPDVDVRYERVYAFIQDDVGKKRPTVDLALNLLCESVEDKLFRLRHFAKDAPLVREGLVRISGADGHWGIPQLSRSIAVDDSVLRFLTGNLELNASLVSFSRFMPAASVNGAAKPTALRRERSAYYIRGTDEEEGRAYVQRSVEERGIVFVDLERAPSERLEWSDAISTLFRESRLAGFALCFEHVDGLMQPTEVANFRHLLERVDNHPRPVFLTGEKTWTTPHHVKSPVIPVELRAPPFESRKLAWCKELQARAIVVPTEVQDEIADLFIFGHSQIANAITFAINHAKDLGIESPTREDLLEGARVQTRGQLGELAYRVETSAHWDDIVLPADVMGQLVEIGYRVAHRGRVLRDWGFGKKLDYGKGISALFAGPSGTGKTMAAGVIARHLGLDLYRVDLSRLISKYIGETAKNIASVFKNNRVLLIDEADAIMGKRTEIHNSNDRHANQDVGFLLQCIESFEGLVILTSNMPGLIDPAFRRRLTMTVYFPAPDEAARFQLWKKIWPSAAPLGSDIDFGALATQFKITGGIIKNAALGAAYLAAEQGPPIAMKHVLHALGRELTAIGAKMPDSALHRSQPAE